MNLIAFRIRSVSMLVAAGLLVFFFSGCALLDFFKKSELPKATPEGLYSRASVEFRDGNYKKAQEYFTRLKEEYPLHELAVLAEIGIADAYFSDKNYVEAESSYSDFVSLHPDNENVPYAIYQKGMCHYNQIGAIDRDMTEALYAKREWETLMARYPQSKFSTMAEKMLRDVKQKLAEREFYVGKFYFNQKKYQAALARFEKIASDYANVGLDYKVEYYIKETKDKIAAEEKKKLEKESKASKGKK